MFLRTTLRFYFAKISKEDVLKSSYDELAALVAKKYSKKQYKTANMVVLHEIQQQYKIIAPGDCILDIGAGPNFYWTELALRLAENDKQTHRVISNDKLESVALRSNQTYVKGNFLEQQVRTNIGIKLGERKIDTILVDASPQFTGNLEQDGAELNKIIFQVMYFSNIFLQKGGKFICKVLNCESSKILQQTARIFFHQFFIFRSSVLRDSSPVQFFVMKGFAMNYQLQAMKKFISQYRGSPKNKTEVVREYQGKYSWDPIQVIRNKAKNDVLAIKMEGRSQKDIQNMFNNDPYIKITDILWQIKLIDKAKMEKDNLGLKRAINKFTQGKLYKQANQIPSTRQEWINYLQKIETELKQMRKKGKEKAQKPVNNLQPLRDNEVYMKDNYKTEDDAQSFLYIEADLKGNYQAAHETQFLEQQIAKLQSNNPQFAKTMEKRRRDMKNKRSLDDVFNSDFMVKTDQIVDRKFDDMTQALQAISDEQFKALMDKEGYQNQLQENVGKRQTGSRQKFKNR